MVNTPYTDYVSSLNDDGSPPDPESVEAVCSLLRRDLIRQLRKRGLWHSPPYYLGKSGSSWHDGDALEDLVHDAYVFIFLERLESLKIRLLVCPYIDGFVVLNIRHMLSGLQREADPIGYRVFRLLRSALLSAVDAQALHVLAGDEGIRNDTVLGFEHDADPEPPPADLNDHVRAWNDDLLPELMTARSRAVTGVVERLTAWILDLRAASVEAFRFKDLIDPMKGDVRRRWEAVWEDSFDLAPDHVEDDGPVIKVPVYRPHEGDDPRDLERIVGCVSAAIDRMPQQKTRERTTKEYLWNLWKFVRGTALTEDPSADGAKRPSDVRLGERLGIPRHRLPDLFGELGRLMKRCRSGADGGSSERSALTSVRENQDTPASSPGERRETS